MIEQISIIAAPINFNANGAEALAAKRVLKLEDLLVGYGPLPDVVKITRMLLADEGGVDYTCQGKVSVAVDPSQRYITPSGFPLVEKIQPKHPKLLGELLCYPGKPKSVIQDHSPPIIYRKGLDRIIVAPVMYAASSNVISLLLAFYVESDFGDWPLDPANVFLQPITGDTGPGAPTLSYRSLIPNVTHGGTTVRVHRAANASGCFMTHQSIGIQSGSGPDMLAAPVPVTYGGTATPPNLPGWADEWSDPIPLTVTAGQSLLIDTRLHDAWGFTDGTTPSWYSTTDSYATATMGGTVTLQPTRTHCVDCVQIT